MKYGYIIGKVTGSQFQDVVAEAATYFLAKQPAVQLTYDAALAEATRLASLERCEFVVFAPMVRLKPVAPEVETLPIMRNKEDMGP